MTERRPDELDVDARFLLANERTLLAWVRTSLTMVAAGVGAHQFLETSGAQLIAALTVALGAVTAGVGARRYTAADGAIRRGGLPARGRASVVLAYGVAVLAAGLLAGVLLD